MEKVTPPADDVKTQRPFNNTDRAQVALDRILEAFESGAVPEAIAKTMLPPSDLPSRKWSLNNRLLMFFAGTEDARGIRQWKQVGRYPAKGSKAFHILVPRFITKTIENEDGEEEKRQILVGFGCCPVFGVESTAGKPLETPDLEPVETPPLMDVASAWGIDVTYVPGNGRSLGAFAPGRALIKLSTHDAGVFFHELAHAAHEKVLGQLKGGQHWTQEVVAELTAAVLQRLYTDQPDDGGAYRYIRAYAESAGKDVHRACMAVVADVQKCLGLILTSTAETATL